jgi:anti-sigma regulatory factor (Ser/Thr protein kinase)
MASSAGLRVQRRPQPLVAVALAMPARVTELGLVHAALDRFWVALAAVGAQAQPSVVWRMQFATAVAEIAGNIAAHAHVSEPVGTLRLRLSAYPDRVEARFSDRGAPYALPLQAALPPPSDHREQALLDAYELDDLVERGRGLAITRAAVDELHYRRTPTGRNHWRLMKRFVG